MAANLNLLPWFETARYARLLTMRPSVLELAPRSPKIEKSQALTMTDQAYHEQP
jgi:hypothetical protein